MAKYFTEKKGGNAQSLKQTHSDDVSIIALNEIENALLNKKYGLVWEEHLSMWMKCYKSIFLFY